MHWTFGNILGTTAIHQVDFVLLQKSERELAEKPGPVYNLHRKNTDESNYTLGKHKTKQKKSLKNMGWDLSLR